MSYDEAVRTRLPALEFEVQLPPIAGAARKGKKKLPSVICSVIVEQGAINKKAMIPRGSGKVSVLPTGRSASEAVDMQTIQAGRTHVTIPMKAGLVDPSWARGRSIFRRGRPTGSV
eukprot:CAMPEP_0198128204 /NCGR_PEP_ID=MMETSP1442-20131203/48802_1 /TAXON_ID= /ORGANISM="Craspedostauros australis, Strain CCMP3328" /LENGTH=115 /DNA_ID=CAMNT_0043788315 /DNA_START=36 /DNA_END=383 /DNA_ORIENTATION=-